jgi:galactokinase
VDRAVEMDGVYGARMTGGGFGGCTVNLVRPDALEAFRSRIAESYLDRYGIAAQSFICEASPGAGEVC